MASVSIKDVEKSFGQTSVLKGVSLEIENGEFISLVGPSGCGKSTLLRIIAGLEAQDAGQIEIADENVDARRAADRNLSMVFQSYALYPHLSVAENIAVPLKMREMNALQRMPLVGPFMPGSNAKAEEIGKAVIKAAETLQINHLLDRKPGQLSGGQRQRVAVGRALVRNPAAFLLDEPLSNLDAKLRVHTRAEIAQLHRQLGATFIYVTHDQVEAMTMSDRIAVMMDGELLQVGTPEDIYDHPLDVRVAEFMGSPKMTILPAETDSEGNIQVLGNPSGLKVGLPSQFLKLGVRPELIEAPSENPVLFAELVHLENLGSEGYAHLRIEEFAETMVVRIDRSAFASISVGQSVGMGFQPDNVHLFDNAGQRIEEKITGGMRGKTGRRMASV